MTSCFIDLTDVFCDVCKLGIRCPDVKCGLFHPEGWNWRRNVMCPSRAACRKWGCQFWHQRGHVPIERKDCESGTECSHRLCADKHPVGWDWHKNFECPTKTCYTKDCLFKHSTGQKLCLCHGCQKMKEPGLVIDDQNYCSQACNVDMIERMAAAVVYQRRVRRHRRRYDEDAYDRYERRHRRGEDW